jgi:hypothetical protein
LWRTVFHQNSGRPFGGDADPRRRKIRPKIAAAETMLLNRIKMNGGITPRPIFSVGKLRPHRNVTNAMRM